MARPSVVKWVSLNFFSTTFSSRRVTTVAALRSALFDGRILLLGACRGSSASGPVVGTLKRTPSV